MRTPVTILGAGAWGTAVATLLAHNGATVKMWCYEDEVAHDITTNHRNKKYLPDIKLSPSITATTNLPEALLNAEWIFEAIPVPYIRSILGKIDPQISPTVLTAPWVILSKGLEHNTLKLPASIVEDVLRTPIHYVVVSGPNFAGELASQVMTASVLAGNNQKIVLRLANLLATSYFKPIASDDPVGAMVGGALKNVMALILGIAHEAPFSHKNTTAYLFAQGLNEIAIITQHYGGKRDTIYGLAGLGDMVLSCTSTTSRNMQFGVLLGRGLTLEQATQQFHSEPEGVATLRSLQKFVTRTDLDIPLCRAAYHCIFEGRPFAQALTDLWSL
ncbi:MAG: NAD(P)H-dependent glycerol-3-phosphate dehydrogenase [Candidatus Babeliales bacterium]|jgi:glycerol-3-phosphate dehydrogenase (NAD(P)+)